MKFTITYLIVLLCGVIALAQPNQTKVRQIHGRAYAGAAIGMDTKGRIAFQTDIGGVPIVESWVRLDSTEFKEQIRDTSAILLDGWGPFGAILDFKLIHETRNPGDTATQWQTFDIGNYQANDTLTLITPFTTVRTTPDYFRHNLDDVDANWNLPNCVGNDTYLLYLKYVRRQDE